MRHSSDVFNYLPFSVYFSVEALKGKKTKHILVIHFQVCLFFNLCIQVKKILILLKFSQINKLDIFLVLTLFTSIFFSVFHSFVLSHVLYQGKIVSRTHSAGKWWERTFAPCPSRELSCLPSQSSSSISSSANRGKNELFHIWLRKVSVHLKVTLHYSSFLLLWFLSKFSIKLCIFIQYFFQSDKLFPPIRPHFNYIYFIYI